MESLFVNPALVPAGAALVASPIIIHIINRLRFRRVRFAAMEFLLQAQQNNRRRILIEQLLLLLLRILIILAIMLLISRLKGGAAQTTHHLVLIDDSGSMQELTGEDDQNAFDRAKQIARQLTERFAKEPGEQRVSVLLLSNPNPEADEDPVLFREGKANLDFTKRVAEKLAGVDCSHKKLDIVSALQAAGGAMTNGKDNKTVVKHLHFISDFRKEDWKSSAAIVQAVSSLTDNKINVNFIQAVKKALPNLAVTGLTGNLQVATAGTSVRFRVTVKNLGTTVAKDVALFIIVDGQAIKRVVRFEKIEAGKSEFRFFDVTFSTPGDHSLRVKLPSDTMPKDNVRYLAIENLPSFNKVLVIDGDPKSTDSVYIKDALASNPKITGNQVETRDLASLTENTKLDNFSSIYLLNVPELSDELIAHLKKYVENGGGLAWFLGDSVNGSHYNTKLYTRKITEEPEGKFQTRVTGLFPVPLAETTETLAPKPRGTTTPDFRVLANHPIFEVLLQAGEEALGIFELKQYRPVSEVPLGDEKITWVRDDAQRNDSVTTIAVLRNKDPFIFEHQLGKGKIFTCLTTAGPKWWIQWSGLKLYPPIINEIQKHIARRRPDKQRVVGQPIVELVPLVQYEKEAFTSSPKFNGKEIKYTPGDSSNKVEKPSDDEKTPEENGEAKKKDAEELYKIENKDTDRPGIYKIIVNRKKADQGGNSGKREVRMFAYNPPLEESAVELIEAKEINAAFSKNENFHLYEFGDDSVLTSKGEGEGIRNKLLILLVLLLLAEQFLAYRLSYHAGQN
jgi:hypothetical protein